jgi:hypothetical protein
MAMFVVVRVMVVVRVWPWVAGAVPLVPVTVLKMIASSSVDESVDTAIEPFQYVAPDVAVAAFQTSRSVPPEA